MLISIIIPAYNEEKIINKFIKQVCLLLNHSIFDYEILIIENGSTDKTRVLVDLEAQINPKIKVFHLPDPSYGQALKLGLRRAKGNYAIVFNVDYWDPKFIKILSQNKMSNVDIVVASKNLPASSDRRPFVRKFVTRIFVIFLRLFLGFKGTDTHGIKIFRKKVIDIILPKCRLTNDLFDSELIIRAQRAGFKIMEVPIKIKEIRPARFKRRFLNTPKDICELYIALKQS